MISRSAKSGPRLRVWCPGCRDPRDGEAARRRERRRTASASKSRYRRVESEVASMGSPVGAGGEASRLRLLHAGGRTRGTLQRLSGFERHRPLGPAPRRGSHRRCRARDRLLPTCVPRSATADWRGSAVSAHLVGDGWEHRRRIGDRGEPRRFRTVPWRASFASS